MPGPLYEYQVRSMSLCDLSRLLIRCIPRRSDTIRRRASAPCLSPRILGTKYGTYSIPYFASRSTLHYLLLARRRSPQ